MLEKVISAIKPLDTSAMEKCRLRLDNLTKPLNSLMHFETIICQMAGITGNPRPRTLPKSIVIVGSDNEIFKNREVVDVFSEHVSATITRLDVRTIIACINGENEKIIKAVECGIKAAALEAARGIKVIGIASTAAGCSDAAKKILETIIVHNFEGKEGLKLLWKAGSYEIACLSGLIIGAAAKGSAVVLDGAASSAAAVVAVQIAPAVRPYLIGSHFAVDPADKVALDILDLPAYLHLDMPGGDGIGAALGLSLINASLHVLNDMKTFGEADVAVAQDGPGAFRQNKAVKD